MEHQESYLLMQDSELVNLRDKHSKRDCCSDLWQLIRLIFRSLKKLLYIIDRHLISALVIKAAHCMMNVSTKEFFLLNSQTLQA